MPTNITKENPVKGGCLCGMVRYTITEKPLFTHACHCVDCQRSTGSAFVVHSYILQPFWQISGETHATKLPTGSGATMEQNFCRNCGTFIWLKNSGRPEGVIILRTCTLDDTNLFTPEAHIFAKDMKNWFSMSVNIPTFNKMYERENTWPAESLERWKLFLDN